jgi:hypothetical protein
VNPLARADAAIRGWPEDVLTYVLIGLAVLALLIAWRGRPWQKAAAVAYGVLP